MTVNGDRKTKHVWKILGILLLVLVSMAIGHFAFRSETTPTQQTFQMELPTPEQPAKAMVPDASQEVPEPAPADANKEDKAADETSAPPKTSRPALANVDKAKPKRVAIAAPKAKPAVTQQQAPSSTSTGTQFRWKHVGGDPCNPKAGCTLDWALAQSGWPVSVQDGLKAKVSQDVSQVYTMSNGWNGWMTWGKNSPKFRANTLADWGSGHTETASLWRVEEGSLVYSLVKVGRCGNWGGWTETGSVPTPVKKAGAPLSVLPTGSCVPSSESIAGQ